MGYIWQVFNPLGIAAQLVRAAFRATALVQFINGMAEVDCAAFIAAGGVVIKFRAHLFASITHGAALRTKKQDPIGIPAIGLKVSEFLFITNVIAFGAFHLNHLIKG